MESVTIELNQINDPSSAKDLLIEHFQLVRAYIYEMVVGSWTYRVDLNKEEYKKSGDSGAEIFFTALEDCVHSALGDDLYSRQPIENTMELDCNDEKYEVLENHKISDCNYEDLIISGGLFSYMVFENVLFKDCTFFASRIENSQFINCKFENCKIQFSHITHSLFSHCQFEGTFWEITPIKKCLFHLGHLDVKTKYFINKSSDNIIKDLHGRTGLSTQLGIKDDSLVGFYLKEYLEAA